MNLSFYTPIAYDYEYALDSIKSYYKIANEIILAIDEDLISWSNKKFDISSEFFDKIKILDIDKKITIIFSNFHKFQEPLRNDTFERNYISELCKKENYIIGIDSDEILLNAEEFRDWIQNFDISFDITCQWMTVYKKFNNSLLITSPLETAEIGTNLRSSCVKARITKNRTKLSPLKVLHFSWGRTREQILQKLQNWSHSRDFDLNNYMKIWDYVTLENYKELKNFHPLKLKNVWQKLELMDLNEVLK